MNIGELELTELDIATHLHIVGSSQHGKSSLAYDLIQQLILDNEGFALIDPNGKLYKKVLAYLVSIAPYRENQVRLLDATRREITACINPFKCGNSPEEIHTKARRLTTITFQIWSAGRPEDRPQINKILFALYVALLELKKPLSEATSLLKFDSFNPNRLKNPVAREIWDDLFSSGERNFKNQTGSVFTKLLVFAHPHLKRLAQADGGIDTVSLMDEGGIFLANLIDSKILGKEECRTLTALFLSDIWDAALNRKTDRPFYVVIDEFQEFATEEIATIMEQAAKFGLHMILLHQDEGQLSPRIRYAMKNASCFIEFIERGYCIVDGRGVGEIEVETELAPEPIITPYLSDQIEQYRKRVSIVAESKPEDVQEASEDLPQESEPEQKSKPEPRHKPEPEQKESEEIEPDDFYY